MTDPAPTLGEQRVGLAFNPSADPAVDAIKRAAANFIDAIRAHVPADAHSPRDPARMLARLRCRDIAEQQAEQAAMWAVKGATR